jgi:3',5'-nucleoside bisphosphate phosphatase
MSDSTGPTPASGFVDLHSHTDASDGSLTPRQLIELAKRSDLDALAITDHDTFAGYEAAVPVAREVSLDLVRGIELNATLQWGDDEAPRRAVHVLAYFPIADPAAQLVEWLATQLEERRNRNRRLAAALQQKGIDITVEEVEARGKTLAGRVHFARILMEKGYVQSSEQAFRRYLGETAPTYVHRRSQTIVELLATIRDSGGIPVIAHPVRLSMAREQERKLFAEWKRAGLLGLEVYHSEHSPVLQAHYRQLAEELELLPTGGSDFHGAAKPDVSLGTGLNGNLRVPREFLDRMRERAARS